LDRGSFLRSTPVDDALSIRSIPAPDVSWDFVIATALRLRDMHQAEDLDPWPKRTGGKGLHLMAPLDPVMTHECRARLCEASRAAARRRSARAIFKFEQTTERKIGSNPLSLCL